MAQAQPPPTPRLRYFIGAGVEEALITKAREKLSGASAHEHYRTGPESRFIFQVLDDQENYAKPIVDSWLDNTDNRTMIAPSGELKLKAYAAIRINKLPRPVRLEKGIREEQGFVVLIPLETWSQENGCFLGDTVIQAGECLCLGGLEPITVPASGTCGLLIWFFIKIEG